MGITFTRFMAIARAVHAWDILECWDRVVFDEYVKEFGPMTEAQAKEMCYFVKAVTDEELAAVKSFREGA